MEQQIESKKQSRARYQTPDIAFFEVDSVWCKKSYEPIDNDNETPSITL